jgi:hypothetical protein
MSRFVLLYHDCPLGVPRASHWDLMLEEKGVLRTWVLAEGQAAWSQNAIPVEEIQPHRLDYLEIEGPLSEERGTITRIDRGTLVPHEIGDLRICAQLSGRQIRGTLELTRRSPTSPWWCLSFSAAEGAPQ